MKYNFKTYQYYLFFGFLFIGLSIFFNSNYFIKWYGEHKIKKTQKLISNLEKDSETIFNVISKKPYEKLDFSDFTPYNNKQFTLLYLKNENPIFWSKNDPIPESVIQRLTEPGSLIIPFEKKTYFVSLHSTENSKIKFYFIQDLTKSNQVNTNSLFSKKELIYFNNNNINEGNLYSLKDRDSNIFIDTNKHQTLYLEISWLLAMLLFFISIYHLFDTLPIRIFKINQSFWLLLIYFFGKLIFKADPFNILESIHLFQPKVFANNYIGQSLGILIINILIITFTVFNWYKYKSRYKLMKGWPKFIKGIILSLYLLFFFFLMSYAVKSVILDSSKEISLEPFQSPYSIIILLILFTLLTLYLFVSLRIIKYVKHHFSNKSAPLLLLFMSIVGLILFNIAFTKSEILFLITWQFICLTVLFFLLHNKKMRINQVSGFVLYYILCAGFCAQNLQIYSQVKSKNNLLQTARKISLEEDDFAKFLIKNFVDQLKSDEVLREQINSPFISLNNIEKRINKELDNKNIESYKVNYEFNNSLESDFITKDIESFSNYKYFRYRVTLPYKNKELTINFEKPKIEESDLETIKNNGFSYAIYENEKLKFLEGNVQELGSINKSKKLIVGESTINRSKDVTTLAYKSNDTTIVLISILEPVNTNNILLLFANFFSTLFFISIIATYFYTNFKITKSKFFKHSFTNQIQYFAIAVLFFTGFIVTIISLKVTSNQFKEVIKNKYESRIDTIVSTYLEETEKENISLLNDEKIIDHLFNTYKSNEFTLKLYNNEGLKDFELIGPDYSQIMPTTKINPLVINDFSKYPLQNKTINETYLDKQYNSFFKVIRTSNFEINSIVELPAPEINETIKEQRSLIIESQFNTFSIVLFLLTILSLFISQSITNTFERLKKVLLGVELGSSQKQIEWESEDEIGRLVKEYNQLVKKLDENAVVLARNERESTWREVAKQVAHEIKNPLTPMKLSIQHLKRRINTDGKSEQDIMIIKTLSALEIQMKNIENISDNFSSISKIDLPKFKKINLVKIINNTIQLYKSNEDAYFNFENNLGENEAYIYADQTMIPRVIHNLLKNSQQAIAKNKIGIITLTLFEDENNFLIDITDNGKGISIHNRAKIFTPNFTTKSSGTGIGLMMTKKIIELHKGSIEFESVVDKGTTFTLKIPKMENEND